MKIAQLRLCGIRCFEDTGHLALSSRCNIFVGQNNTGKSTILKALLALQGMPFSPRDLQKGNGSSYVQVEIDEMRPVDRVAHRPNQEMSRMSVTGFFRGTTPPGIPGIHNAMIQNGYAILDNERPTHVVVPLLAKRKAVQFDHTINERALRPVTGTFSNLYGRIDQLATAGQPRHELFKEALANIVGLKITTNFSANGKEAGFFLDDETFIPMDQMGDGISEMVGLIVDLCTERRKIFVLEEPETNLHPRGLKALLSMVRESSNENQFIIATHSNIVVRELGFDEATRVFRTYKTGGAVNSPSSVEQVPRTPQAHAELLRELGYEFADLGLFEAWLFLEEASAESVIQQVLIPMFVPGLRGRLRTFAAAGVDDIEPSVHEFQRLMVFLHLEPMYKGKVWVRADGDEPGKAVVKKLREKFDYLTDETCAAFSQDAFERYYPQQYAERVAGVLSIQNKKERRTAKQELILDVIKWSRENPAEAKSGWAEAAIEVIGLLKAVVKSLK